MCMFMGINIRNTSVYPNVCNLLVCRQYYDVGFLKCSGGVKHHSLDVSFVLVWYMLQVKFLYIFFPNLLSICVSKCKIFYEVPKLWRKQNIDICYMVLHLCLQSMSMDVTSKQIESGHYFYLLLNLSKCLIVHVGVNSVRENKYWAQQRLTLRTASILT